MTSDRTTRPSRSSAANPHLPTLLANKVRRVAGPSGASSRARLLPNLGELKSTRLFVLKALAGYGKTTLLRQYADLLERHDFAVAWLRLDRSDNQPGKAVAYLVAAFAEIEPRIATDLSPFISAVPPLPVDEVLAALIHRLETCEKEVYLLIDDYHSISSSDVHRAFFYFLRNLPRNFHVVVASRHLPPWDLAGLAEGGAVRVLEEAEIRFSLDEIADYVERCHGLQLDDAGLRSMHRQTDGWISAVKLVSHDLQRRHGRPLTHRMDPGAHRNLIDYLASSVFDWLDPEIQDFLLQTAPLERLSPSLCDAVTGANNAAAMIDRLVRENLFIEPLDSHGGWHRYHALFSEFLTDRLDKHPVLKRATIHRRASYWFEVNRQPQAAAEHAMAAGDGARNEALIESAILAMVRASQITLAMRWFETLPETFSDNKPNVLIPLAWCNLYSRRTSAAQRLLDRAKLSLTEGLQQLSDADRGGLEEFTAEIEIAQLDLTWSSQGDLPDAKRLQAIKEKLAPHWYFLRAYVELLLCHSYIHQDRLDAAFAAASDSVVFAKKVPNAFVANLALEQLAQIRYLQGRLGEARQLCEQAVDVALTENGQPLPVVCHFHLLLAHLHYETNDLEASRRHLDTAVHLTAEPDILSEAEILSAKHAAVFQGERAAIGQLIEYNNTRLDQSTPLSMNAVRSHQAWFLTSARELDSAEGVLRQLGAPVARAGPPAAVVVNPLFEFQYLAMCHYLIAAGKAEVAVNWLRQLLRIAERSGRIRSCISINGLLAMAQTQRDQPESALRYLREMLALGEQGGFARTILDLGEDVIPLLVEYRAKLAEPARVATQDPRADYVRQLLEAAKGAGGPVTAGGPQARRRPAETAPADRDYDTLTKREVQILEMISSGRRNRDVAEELLIAESSVRWHVRNLYAKLGVHNRTEASVKGRSMKLIH